MDPRVALLALPSALVLVLLVAHSLVALPRARALAFWPAVLVYGVLRRLGVEWVTVEGLGGAQPYEIHDPLLPVFGVPSQELAGWAVVAYLGWWLGHRLARRFDAQAPPLFVQVLWASLFLAAVSWAVEAAAVAAGWWHWTLPVSNPLFLNVPFIGIVDWFFVGIDFLLPFLALTAAGRGLGAWRWATLLAFPLHFGSHLLIEPVAPWLPIPVFHLVHWLLLGGVLWLALRLPIADDAFAPPPGVLKRWLPAWGLALVVADLVVVDLVVAEQPLLLLSLLPLVTLAAVSLMRDRPAGKTSETVYVLKPFLLGCVAFTLIMLGFWLPAAWVSLIPPGVAGFVRRVRARRRGGRALALAALALLALLALRVHSTSALRQQALEAGLDEAIAARDRGDFGAAESTLAELAEEHPGTHAPSAFLAEIHYRRGRLEAARERYAEAVRIKSDYLEGYRHLAVIGLRLEDLAGAARHAEAGLEIAPGDLQLRYLARRAAGGDAGELAGEPTSGPEAAALAALAFEVGDLAGARELLDAAVERWPDEKTVHRRRVQAALAAKDLVAAARAARSWLDRHPDDPEARRAVLRLSGS